MNAFISSFNSMKLAYILVIVTFALLPWAIMTNGAPLLGVLLLFLFIMNKYNIKGSIFVVMAIALCLPFVPMMEDTAAVFFADKFKWLNRTIYISILLSFLFIINKKHKASSKSISKKYLVLISFGMVINSLRFGVSEAISTLFVLLAVPIMFYISYRGRENWNDLYYMFTVFFFCLTIYAVIEFFFKVGPYMPLRIFSYKDYFRVGSLLGNSLCLTGFLMAYHVMIFINYYITGKLSTWLILATAFIIMLTGSRTAFIVLVAIWFAFVAYLIRGLRGKGKIIGILLAISLLLAGIALLFFGDYVSSYYNRFSEGSEHRASGLQTTINILSSNPLGVGNSGTDKAFDMHSADGWSAGMRTVDNVYLNFFIKSGFLFIIPFLFYFFIPLNAYYHSFRNKHYRILVMLFIPYALCGLSFDINAFIQLNIVYFGIAGHLYRIINT